MSIEGSENKEESAPGNQAPSSQLQAPVPPQAGPNPKPQPGNGAAGKGPAGNGASFRCHSPSSVELPVVEPWPEAVEGKELLDAIMSELLRFVAFPKWAAETFTLWILHTFAYWLRDVTTYIGIESPEKECGKSTLVTVLSHFVNRAAVSSNISSSAFFRAIDELQPTLLIDEADTNLRGKDELTGILNSGYTKPTAFVWRICYEPAPGREAEETPGGAGVSNSAGRVARYSCWCPKAIAAIGHLHPTLASRCVVIRMHRKTEGEECERLKRLNATDLQRKCARFVADHAAEIAGAEPQIPKGLTNRAADIWEPLLALADLAGGRWPELARAAACGLTARAQEYSPIGSLLMDIYVVFAVSRSERIFSRDLVAALLGCGDRPWSELRKGKPVTETWVAQQLRPYGIKPRTIRIGELVAKGYVQEEFMDTFRRYIPKSEVETLKAEWAERDKPKAAQGDGTGEKANGGAGADNSPKGPDVEE